MILVASGTIEIVQDYAMSKSGYTFRMIIKIGSVLNVLQCDLTIEMILKLLQQEHSGGGGRQCY